MVQVELMGIYRSPDHWRERAKQARQSAESITDPLAKHAMLATAGDYERTAQRVEARERGRSFLDRETSRKRAFS